MAGIPTADYRVECIQVICPHCGEYLEAEEGGHIPARGESDDCTMTLGPNEYLPLRGKIVACPACRASFRMPRVSMERRRRRRRR